MHAQDFHFLRQFGIARDAHPGVAERSQVLTWKERETADVADAAGPSAIAVFGADGLRGARIMPTTMMIDLRSWRQKLIRRLRAQAVVTSTINTQFAWSIVMD